MNKLATLSAQEREQIINDFVDEVFAGLEPDMGLAARLRRASPTCRTTHHPSKWTPGWSWPSWSRTRGSRRRIRAMAEKGARARAADPVTDEEEARTPDFVARVLEHAGAGR